METINGTITGVAREEGIGKTGKPFTRWVFSINDKKYSTFDAKIGDVFKAGMNIEMEGEQDGVYWNMKTMKEFAQTEKPGTTTPMAKNNHTTMYVSYAKDIFICLVEKFGTGAVKEQMQVAIDLVKQAKEAFE
uniref:Uncharacterized protein n=1 Tax=viral metagenome TaxID=1070528 RepID=A0A6H1ZUM4_9ZZZZ